MRFITRCFLNLAFLAILAAPADAKDLAKRFPNDTAMEVYTPSNPPPAGLTDAPSDGTTYGRKDGSWTGISFALVKNAPATKTIVFDGDYRGQYVFSSVKKLPYQENGAGITITSVTVSSDVTPTTQLNLSLNYCDAQVTNFPGANIVNLSTFTTTAGAYSSGVISYQVPSGYPLYVLFNADPTDFGIPWQLKLTYTVN